MCKCYVTKMWEGGVGMGMINGGFTVKVVKLKLLGMSLARAASRAVGRTTALCSRCDIFFKIKIFKIKIF